MAILSFLVALFLATPTANAAACCSKHNGGNFCDALTKKTVCVDGVIDKKCPCTYKPVYSDVCTVAALYNIYESKKATHADLTNLTKKSWWSQCAPWTRKKVYALLLKRVLK